MRSILPPAHTFRGLLCLGASLLALVAVTNALAAHSSSLAGGAFGQTQAGSSLDTGGAGYLDVSGPYTVAGPVSVGKLSAYVAGGASVSEFRGVIYADNGGQPGALVGVTPEVTIAAGRAVGWVDLTFTTPVSIGAGSFWLGYWYADSNSRHYFVGQAGAERFVRATYASSSSPPATFGAAATSSSSYSVYATYSTP